MTTSMQSRAHAREFPAARRGWPLAKRHARQPSGGPVQTCQAACPRNQHLSPQGRPIMPSRSSAVPNRAAAVAAHPRPAVAGLLHELRQPRPTPRDRSRSRASAQGLSRRSQTPAGRLLHASLSPAPVRSHVPRQSSRWRCHHQTRSARSWTEKWKPMPRQLQRSLPRPQQRPRRPPQRLRLLPLRPPQRLLPQKLRKMSCLQEG
mmetsp:Transcript_13065/g.29836  ORF Transcript_13065/g.29836 Transcript_13065/m.29836 type:complete len:205 (-) Transcript_13065:430-1044(-)